MNVILCTLDAYIDVQLCILHFALITAVAAATAFDRQLIFDWHNVEMHVIVRVTNRISIAVYETRRILCVIHWHTVT